MGLYPDNWAGCPYCGNWANEKEITIHMLMCSSNPNNNKRLRQEIETLKQEINSLKIPWYLKLFRSKQ